MNGETATSTAGRSLWADAWKRLSRSPAAMVCLGVVALYAAVAVLAPLIITNWASSYDYQARNIAPGARFLLGTDALGRSVLHKVLLGAHVSMTVGFFANAIAVPLGMLLGALAGWWHDSWFDRAVLRLVELFAALPDLVLAVILVYAVGMRQGQGAFVAALALAGWGEAAQILRSHVLGIRRQEYIQSARAVGLSPLGILSRHVLPNLTGTVLTLASLEIGRTLLLLGELGFIQVFVGGGILMPGDVGQQAVLAADIPEWGALLGMTWRSFRTYPWLPGAPAAAFFLAVTGFTLFGYGLKQFLERGRFYPSGVSVFRFLAAVFLVLVGLQFALARSGPEMWFRADAAEFDGSLARRHVLYLTQAAFHGRSEGSAEAALSSAYIGRQFRESGLTTLRGGDYYQSFPVAAGEVVYEAQLKLTGEEPLRFSRPDGFLYDFSTRFASTSAWETDDLLFVGNPARTASALFPQGLYFLLDEQNPYLRITILAPQEVDWYAAPRSTSVSMDVIRDMPAFLIAGPAAQTVLARSGLDLGSLEQAVGDSEERLVVPLGQPARLEAGVVYDTVLGINVVGYLPGGDSRLSHSRILVAAPYTTPPASDQLEFPGADENASAAGVLLETLRVLEQMGFQPRRTVVFAAVSQSGLDHLLRNPVLSTQPQDEWTLILLEGLGAGQPALARMETGGGLAALFDSSARLMEATSTSLEAADSGAVQQVRSLQRAGVLVEQFDVLVISRPGDSLSGTPEDRAGHLDRDLLQQAGEVFTHFLLVLGSQ